MTVRSRLAAIQRRLGAADPPREPSPLTGYTREMLDRLSPEELLALHRAEIEWTRRLPHPLSTPEGRAAKARLDKLSDEELLQLYLREVGPLAHVGSTCT
jgi:hypothetical protein